MSSPHMTCGGLKWTSCTVYTDAMAGTSLDPVLIHTCIYSKATEKAFAEISKMCFAWPSVSLVHDFFVKEIYQQRHQPQTPPSKTISSSLFRNCRSGKEGQRACTCMATSPNTISGMSVPALRRLNIFQLIPEWV